MTAPVFINAWNTKNKSWAKSFIKIRIGKVTILDIYIDLKKWKKPVWGFVVLNVGLRSKRKYDDTKNQNRPQDTYPRAGVHPRVGGNDQRR